MMTPSRNKILKSPGRPSNQRPSERPRAVSSFVTVAEWYAILRSSGARGAVVGSIRNGRAKHYCSIVGSEPRVGSTE